MISDIIVVSYNYYKIKGEPLIRFPTKHSLI